MIGRLVLGIDPGYARCGWGVIRVDEVLPNLKVSCLGFGCIETPKEEELSTRLAFLDDALQKIIKNYRPHDVAIETLFFGKNKTSGINVAHARGVVLMRAAYHSGKIFQYRPQQVKFACTGINTADKKQVQHGVASFLGYPSIPKPDDAADALAVALAHAYEMTKDDEIS